MMRKEINRKEFDIKEYIYYLIYAVFVGGLIIMYINKSIHRSLGMDIVYCLNDVVGFVEHFVKNLSIPMFGFLVILQVKDYFRAAVIIRSVNARVFVKAIVKKIVVLALICSIYQVLVTVMLGIFVSNYACNWLEENSLVYMRYGVSNAYYIATLEFCLYYFISILLNLIVTGSIIITIWMITNHSYMGYIVVLILVVLELAVYTPFIRVVYSVTDLNLMQIYFTGIGTDFILRPVIISIVCLILQLVLFERKDYLEVK